MNPQETRCWRWNHEPPHNQCVGEAREIVRKTLADWGLIGLADDVALIVSELVTNAVTHARSRIKLTLAVNDAYLSGEITDHGPGWIPAAIPQPVDTDSEGGRGLGIVAALAHSWGAAPNFDGQGMRVWFAMRKPA